MFFAYSALGIDPSDRQIKDCSLHFVAGRCAASDSDEILQEGEADPKQGTAVAPRQA
jgi:hypothetical protein